MTDAVTRRVSARFSGASLASALGVLAASGQAPLGWAWLSVAAFALCFGVLLLPERWQVVAWRGWFFGSGYFGGALFWIVEPFFVDPLRHGWMAPFALVFMAGGLALFWAAAFGLAARLGGTPRMRAAWLVLTLVTAELLRSFLLTGFPWALVGHVWIGAPQMQAAALVGAHGLTFLTLVAAALPAVFGSARMVFGALSGIALLGIVAAWGSFRLPDGPAPLREPSLYLRLVQPNAPQHEKWQPEMIPVFYDRQLELTRAAPAPGQPKPDVVIWPETAIPWLLEHAGPAFAEISAAGQGAQVLVGVQRRGEDGAWYNSLAQLAPGGALEAYYDKHHLVPFGEYMPMMHLFAQAGVFGLAANETGGYTAGPGPALLDLGGAGRVLPLICYEAIFPAEIALAPGRADWIVHVTNDAWFGRVSGPWQHLAQAQLRAVEVGLPVMRAANTGISAAIDPYGRILEALPLGEAGRLDTSLPAALPPTPYARFGDLPVLVVLAMLGIVLSLMTYFRRPSHSG